MTGPATSGNCATPSRRWSCWIRTASWTWTICRRNWWTLPEPPTAPGEGPTSLIGQPLSEIERWAIEQTLKLTNGNREETARILGIGARTLYRKLDKYQD